MGVKVEVEIEEDDYYYTWENGTGKYSIIYRDVTLLAVNQGLKSGTTYGPSGITKSDLCGQNPIINTRECAPNPSLKSWRNKVTNKII